MNALVSHDIGGVQGHSTTDFWEEYDLYKVHDERRIPWIIMDTLRSRYGAKKMVYRYMKDGRSVIGTVVMMRKQCRAAISEFLGLKLFVHLFQDAFWTVGLPSNIGGGAFTRPLLMGNWDNPADAPCPQVGWIHEVDAEASWDKDFVFNDFTQNRIWSVDKDRVPFPGRKATRSLGRAYTPSVGHRYGSNVHA